MNTLLWVGLPYACLGAFIVGLIWRWRSDQFGWTSRSSQWHENAILRWASPLFHIGIICAFFGHVAGMLVPASWTQAAGISEHAYHLGATVGGALAGLAVLIGLVGLLIRRFVTKTVRLATTRGDIVMYVFLAVPIVCGCAATFLHQVLDEGYDYRATVGPWIRSILSFTPRPELMADVPLAFKIHVVAGLLLFAVLPATRLVHIVSAPITYPTRPAIVYRSREAASASRDGLAASRGNARGYHKAWRPVRKQSHLSDSVPYQGA